jgi:hypothetical protein
MQGEADSSRPVTPLAGLAALAICAPGTLLALLICWEYTLGFLAFLGVIMLAVKLDEWRRA